MAIADVDLEEAEKTASELKRLGTGVIAVQCDVTNQDQVNDMVGAVVARFGSLDVAFATRESAPTIRRRK